jgi:hypothetical protein
MEPQHKCPYCFISPIRTKHVESDHLKMTLDLTEIPLHIISELKGFFVKRQDFITAAKIRQFEKVAQKQQELLNNTDQKDKQQ